jgi:hypothetical protein
MNNKKTALRVTDLRTDAVYYSPRGRMCKLLPTPKLGIGSGGDMFCFVYIGSQVKDDCFWLTAANVRLMRMA